MSFTLFFSTHIYNYRKSWCICSSLFSSPLFVSFYLIWVWIYRQILLGETKRLILFSKWIYIFHAAITNMYHLFILPAFMRALCHTFERVGGCVSVCVTSWDLFEKSSSAFTLPLSLQSLLNHSISWQCFDFIPSTANTHIWQWMRVY